MNRTTPSSLIISTWVNIATDPQYPEAQEIAIKKLLMYFDDLSHAELYLAMEEVIVSGEVNAHNSDQYRN